uniref:Tetraacyldisaccharide 4'-kinase n=1 Tax=uncultured Prevotella sp. TaxID=159272 RepID=A0A6G8F162_9BACT|nr:tetraacyldisaccharide 4'-kinase [uncultured Prevotella sp.]
MEGDFIKINKWLLPLSWLYGIGVWLRNLLFDTGVIKSRTFDVPVISVGNITVGGSGKTPHVEYLISLLHDKVKVAVLSRGYKRKSRGYRLAGAETTMPEIGDEPYQMHRKFPDIHVAVEADRCKGIETLLQSPETQDTQLVLLDDAYQHRYVKPGMNILLVDYHRLIIYDKLLPAGRLREPKEGKNRADIVIITKCPRDLKPMSFRVLQRAMALFPFQQLYFTTIDQCPLEPLFEEGEAAPKEENLPNVLLVTGIASPEQMVKDLKGHCRSITPMQFGDHHQFTASDVEAINMAYKMMEKPAIIITTEKDATRLETVSGLSEEVRKNTYVQPIRISFMLNEGDKFNNNIIDYVRKHQKNGRMAERTDDNSAASGNSAGDRTRTIGFRNNRYV